MTNSREYWSRLKYGNISTCTLSSVPAWYQEAFQSLFRDIMIQCIRETLGRPRLFKVVDMGCGPGDWSIKFLDFSERVIGVDINPDFIDTARRLALANPNSENIEFMCMDLLDFRNYRQADLICMGACLQYLDNDELEVLLGRLSAELPRGAMIYVRTTITNPFRSTHQTAIGYFRSRREYQERFRRHDFQTVEACHSRSLIPSRIIKDFFTGTSLRNARILTAPVWLLSRLFRCLRHRTDFYNWLLVKTG